MDSRRYLSTFAVLSLVLLRLVIGWHFFCEGGKKLEYDRQTGQWRMVFSAEDFLSLARGPLAELYHSHIPSDHGFRDLLTQARQNVPPTAEQSAAEASWLTSYNARRAEATKAGTEPPVEFSPSAPYHDWAVRISDDWRKMRDDFKYFAGLTDEQKKRADEAYAKTAQTLADNLSSESQAIAEYRHELWRLDNWRESPEAKSVPYVTDRITTKTAETKAPPLVWLNEVRDLQAQYQDDLRSVLTPEQQKDTATAAAIESALADPAVHRLDTLNVVVTAITFGVGICLLLGFFTRLAGIVGAIFLLGVILSQPPWLPDSLPTITYCLELPALLVLAGTRAGRWMGLDYFTWAFFERRRAAN